MNEKMLTSTGKLKKRLLPAMYLDTSVLIDYWTTQGLEIAETEEDELRETYELPLLPVVKEIMRSENRIKKVIEIRKKLALGKSTVTPVVSPLALLELIEWHAEAGFKQVASEASGALFIQRKGKKEIGDYLKTALEWHGIEAKDLRGTKRSEAVGILSTGLDMLMDETMLNPSFAVSHGLQGLHLVDIVTFSLPMARIWDAPYAYAYLQLGLADIMHILVAKHLGCEYIASFDSDFKRVRDAVSKETGISVLTSPEQMLAKL